MNLDKVEVYFNSHKNLLSVRVAGKVVAHTKAITLRDATFHVSEAGRQRVLAERKKNQHATIKGRFISFNGPTEILGDQVRYNPYEHETFVKNDGTPVHRAFEVAINGRVMQVIDGRPPNWDQVEAA